MIAHNSLTQAIVGLGANLRKDGFSLSETLNAALQDLDSETFFIQKVSRFYKTPCFPVGAGPDYVNAVVLLETRASPQDVLSRLHAIEAAHGRRRKKRWGGRVLDLDLLTWGDQILPDKDVFWHWLKMPHEDQKTRTPDQLILPHPRIQDRAFVLVPMNDIAADWKHPVLGLTVAGMLAALPAGDRAAIRPL